MKQLIEFKKQRELGEIISDSFVFLRNEFKPFLTTILKITGPYLILFLFASSFYLYTTGGVLDFDATQGAFPVNFGMMMIGLLIFAVTAVLCYSFAGSSALHYIKYYIEHDGQINELEIKKQVYTKIWGFMGLGILKWISIVLAAMLCFLPVLYVMVPMFLVFSIYIFENKDASETYSYSFSLIKEEFWMTFITIVIMGIIVMVASYAFSLPASIYSMVKMGVFSGEINPAEMNSFIDPVYIVLNVLSYLFQFLLNLILTISAALIYFNLNEKKHFTGTLERIDAIGKEV